MSESNGSIKLDGQDQGADAPKPPATPRWVKITGAVLAVLVLAIVAMLAFGGGIGGHGPSMHSDMGATSLSGSGGFVVQGLPAL